MFELMDSTGSNMPTKMMPMKPAIKNSSNGSANVTAVFMFRSSGFRKTLRRSIQTRVDPVMALMSFPMALPMPALHDLRCSTSIVLVSGVSNTASIYTARRAWHLT